jgi:uncharacterized protein (TIGR02285 family)
MHRLLQTLLAASLLTLACLAPAAGQTSAPTVTWHVGSFPPYSMVGGQEDGRGAFDLARRLMIRSMPAFRHDEVEAAYARTLESVRTDPVVCRASLIPTREREAVMRFSTPFMQLLPNALVTRRKSLPLFQPFINERGEVRLDAALGSGRVRIGQVPNRSYGPAIDSVLGKHPAAVVVVQVRDQFASRLLKLAYQDEYEAIIGYAVELRHTVQQQKMKQEDFAVLPIAEGTGLVPVAVGCSKTEQGRLVIAAIDRSIAAHRGELDDLYRHLLDGESLAYYNRQLKLGRTAK